MFAVTLLFALVTRALIPAGFMPTSTPYGMTMALCSGLGAIDDTAPDDEKGEAAKPCTFAAINTELSDAPVLTLVVPRVVFTAFAPDAAIVGPASHRLAAPPPPAIGPPAQV